MTNDQAFALKEAQEYVTGLLTSKLSKNIKFHTLNHTQEVVAACEELAEAMHINTDDKFALLLAAWFHDTGYIAGSSTGHEAASVQIADEFMNARTIPESQKAKVRNCIAATKMPQTPDSDLEKIICDADLYHLGTHTFDEKNKLLRQELNEFGDNDVSKKDWRKINIRFLERHSYFTPYAQQKLQPVKDLHLAELKEKKPDNNMAKPDKIKKEKENSSNKHAEQLAAAEAKAKKAKDNQTERGISTVFRIMAQNQANLSQMADAKANIMISVNSIILTIVISTLFIQLETKPYLRIPAVLLVLVCVSAIVFSILATRPNITHGRFTEDDIRNKRTNLLFFGNFYKMNLPDYSWAMEEMLKDRDYLYDSIVKDNYFLGIVLAKKYKLLRIAYNIFMFGLIIVMLAFAIATMLPKEKEVYLPG